jgi:hypothetical protein
MSSFQVENYNVTEISEEELLNVAGGGLWDKIYDATIGYVVGEVFDGVYQGLSRPCENKCK